MAIALSVNLNKIALIRNSREGNYPNVVAHGRLCLEAGAQGLTVHPRPDQRHIRPADVRELRALVSCYKGTEFNIEGNPFAAPQGAYPGLLSLIEETRPEQVTLVPDSNEQLTSDHGFDLTKDCERLKPIIEQIHEYGCRISLFMDPDLAQIKLAATLGVQRIELYTGPFANTFSHGSPAATQACLNQFSEAAQCARALGLAVNAGHDLNLDNMQLFKTVPALSEVSIGHALTVDALSMGLENAVKAYLEVCG